MHNGGDEQDALRPAPARSQHHGQQQHQQQSSSSRRQHGGEPHFDIRQHPAAIAYAASHPNRTIPKFGPYILLQTLGEGEFGKVKLGLHSQWAEEVAVKLIRRGSVENEVRMQKIRREIQVLETLKHPNIVRLYEVIETDKYIGIILDYASGGELFDHILAHRYLKEKDARKLFAQLISAVWYIHQKKIVHRDLKLENLLLDRNRNIIVTDFGFANRFEHKSDDLMQTSCGSPCYAAPELVISEGMYVGSAVDIWSCGVILYAMLAGYLPFDDDPENPEGDNIQQLYRYILNTPLTFPDHVSAEARDLLHKMLVPDPAQRSTLAAIMEHSWLQPYAHLFTQSIEESEKLSKEMQDAKRHQYRKQMREREREQARQARAQAQRREHHQTHVIEPSTSSRDARAAADRLYDPSAPPGGSGAYTQQDRTGRRAVASAIVMPSSPPEDDHVLSMTSEPFPEPIVSAVSPSNAVVGSPVELGPSQAARDRKASTKSHSSKKGQSSRSPTAESGIGASPVNGAAAAGASNAQKSSKKAGGFRHTIQLEYDDGAEVQPSPPTPPRPSSRSRAAAAAAELPSDMANLNLNGTQPEGDFYFANAEASKQSPTKSRRSSTASRPPVPIPAVPAIPPYTTGRRGSNASPVLARNAATDPGPGWDHAQQDTGDSSATTPMEQPTPPPEPTSAKIKSRPSSSSGRRHVRGISIDRIVGFGKMITGGGKDTTNATTGDSSPVTGSPTVSKGSGLGKRSSSRSGRKGGEVAPPLNQQEALESKSSVGPPTETTEGSSTTVAAPVPTTPGETPSNDVSMSESTSGSVKSKRRGGKALSLMVDPIVKMKDRSKNRASVTVGAEMPSKEDRKAKITSTPISAQPDADTAPTPFPEKTESSTNVDKHGTTGKQGWHLPLFRDASVRGSQRAQTQRAPAAPVVLPIVSPTQAEQIDPYHAGEALTGMAPTGATTKSQGVMDWFRKKSLAKERRRAGSVTEPPSIMPTVTSGPIMPTNDAEAERAAAVERDATGDRAKTPTQSSAQEEAKTPTRGSFRKGKNPPSVVVTAATDPAPSNASQKESVNSSSTTPSRMDRVVGAIKNVTHVPPAVNVPTTSKRSGGSSGASFGGSSSGGASYNKLALRLHDGPVDPSTLSTAPPQEIIAQVLEVLKALGIEYTKESEFKYRCVRPKKRKHGAREASGSGTGNGTTASTSGNGLDKRGLPLPTSTFASTGNMFKYIMRRSSSQAPPAPNFGSSAPIAFDEDALDLGTPTAEPTSYEASSSTEPKVEPIYGDKTDQHDEVRFSVEVTKIDRLDDLLSLDIRRLKGNLKSYKFLYDIIRERCNLQR